ncbi:hypothetical protein L0F63_002116, partial [Massospora cicadina]
VELPAEHSPASSPLPNVGLTCVDQLEPIFDPNSLAKNSGASVTFQMLPPKDIIALRSLEISDQSSIGQKNIDLKPSLYNSPKNTLDKVPSAAKPKDVGQSNSSSFTIWDGIESEVSQLTEAEPTSTKVCSSMLLTSSSDDDEEAIDLTFQDGHTFEQLAPPVDYNISNSFSDVMSSQQVTPNVKTVSSPEIVSEADMSNELSFDYKSIDGSKDSNSSSSNLESQDLLGQPLENNTLEQSPSTTKCRIESASHLLTLSPVATPKPVPQISLQPPLPLKAPQEIISQLSTPPLLQTQVYSQPLSLIYSPPVLKTPPPLTLEQSSSIASQASLQASSLLQRADKVLRANTASENGINPCQFEVAQGSSSSELSSESESDGTSTSLSSSAQHIEIKTSSSSEESEAYESDVSHSGTEAQPVATLKVQSNSMSDSESSSELDSDSNEPSTSTRFSGSHSVNSSQQKHIEPNDLHADFETQLRTSEQLPSTWPLVGSTDLRSASPQLSQPRLTAPPPIQNAKPITKRSIKTEPLEEPLPLGRIHPSYYKAIQPLPSKDRRFAEQMAKRFKPNPNHTPVLSQTNPMVASHLDLDPPSTSDDEVGSSSSSSETTTDTNAESSDTSTDEDSEREIPSNNTKSMLLEFLDG